MQYLGAEKTIPLLGMTSVGDYGPNNCSVDNPTSEVPYNFAGVIYLAKTGLLDYRDYLQKEQIRAPHETLDEIQSDLDASLGVLKN